MTLSGVPLDMYGVNVGAATINDDGTVDLQVNSPCVFGKDWLNEFAAGQHTGLSLMPSGMPVPPQPAPASDEPLTEDPQPVDEPLT